jgi:hypothetical protein
LRLVSPDVVGVLFKIELWTLAHALDRDCYQP